MLSRKHVIGATIIGGFAALAFIAASNGDDPQKSEPAKTSPVMKPHYKTTGQVYLYDTNKTNLGTLEKNSCVTSWNTPLTEQNFQTVKVTTSNGIITGLIAKRMLTPIPASEVSACAPVTKITPPPAAEIYSVDVPAPLFNSVAKDSLQNLFVEAGSCIHFMEDAGNGLFRVLVNTPETSIRAYIEQDKLKPLGSFGWKNSCFAKTGRNSAPAIPAGP